MSRVIQIRFKFVWYDLWIGAYWDRQSRWLYVCPLPMCVFIIALQTACQAKGHTWKSEGGRACPRDVSGCSQTVYQCSRCGEQDYGYPGGPAHAECAECTKGQA